jgi:hypothetical protein
MEENYITTCINIMQPVFEKSIVLAGQYTKACNRKTITSKDVEYCMKYLAMYKVGEDIGSLFPEVYEEDSEDEEIEEVDEDEEPFTRYSGDEQLYNEINDAHDAWNEWTPTNPAENMLKNAIDKHNE